MELKSVFNAAVCAIGIAILLVHTVNILLKKDRRKDENYLLIFVVFTIVHFSTYLAFTLIKPHYTSDSFIMTFYTIFYIMNNVESLLLFTYMLSFVPLNKKTRDISQIANITIFGIFVTFDIINMANAVIAKCKQMGHVLLDPLNDLQSIKINESTAYEYICRFATNPNTLASGVIIVDCHSARLKTLINDFKRFYPIFDNSLCDQGCLNTLLRRKKYEGGREGKKGKAGREGGGSR